MTDEKNLRICLFGGSFDPVHQGHLHIARRAQEIFQLDQVVFLPCAQSPLKKTQPHASDEQRVQMLRLATAPFKWAEVSTLDLEWPPPSWSWRVAEFYQKKYPTAILYWLMGTDQWVKLKQWNRWQYLASLVTFIVYHRGEIPQAIEGVKGVFIEGCHPASSSAIRANFKSCPDEWLPLSVKEFINMQSLYF